MTDIINNFGVDSKIGLIATTIMGSTETAFYIISVYTGAIGNKKCKGIILPALIGEVVGITVSVVFWRFLS